jgi:hypothetical protein
MAGAPLEQFRFGWHGPGSDRAFAFLRLADTRGLLFLSLRICPGLAGYTDCGRPAASS